MIIGMTYKMDSVMNCLIINKPEVEFRIPPPGWLLGWHMQVMLP